MRKSRRGASLALAAGNELEVIHDQLGHASVVLMADTYVSVEPALAWGPPSRPPGWSFETHGMCRVSAGCCARGLARPHGDNAGV